MGWFSGWSSSPQPQPSADQNDPLRNLDPELRKFFDKETPTEYKPSSTTSPQSSPPPHPPPDPETQQPAPSPAIDPPAPRAAPRQSLYPDGRYAHLWSTYEPLSAIENASVTEQDKLTTMLEGHKLRKADVGRAALENCVLEEEALHNCLRDGGFTARMTMCRAQNRGFERCYTLQTRFLKALGYLSATDRSASVDEEIQMHADTLYHRMLDQEKAQEAARAAGLPVPQFPPIISQQAPATPAASALSDSRFSAEPGPAPQSRTVVEALAAAEKKAPQRDYFTPEARAELEKRTKDQPEYVREIEEKALRAEAESDFLIAKELEKLRSEKQQQERDERRERGESTLENTTGKRLWW